MLSQNPKRPVIGSVGDIESLRRLILAAKKGDTDAFGEVYTTLYTPLYRYTLSRCHDVELANDVCQQTFLRFYEALDGYEPDKTPLAYLFTIAKRLLINHHEKRSAIPFDDVLLETTDDSSVDIVQESHIRLLAESIDGYLPSLTGDEQEIIRLHFYGELSHKEIGDLLDKEEASVRKIKERALKKLRILTRHLYE
jgi:RNA polymerase sigma-70 factor (ECF subfamily)